MENIAGFWFDASRLKTSVSAVVMAGLLECGAALS
jgi:hypothetical protein